MGTKMNWDRVRKEKRHFTNGSVSVQSEGTWGLPPVSKSKPKQIVIVAPPRLSKGRPIQPQKLVLPRQVEMSRNAKKRNLLELTSRLSEAIEKNNMQVVAKLASEIYGESFLND